MKITIEYKDDLLTIEAHQDMSSEDVISILQQALDSYTMSFGGWEA